MIWWCRGCGMEDTRQHDACPSCGSALREANLEWLKVGETQDETVFELELEPIERAAIIDALVEHNIRHRWDDLHELVVEDVNVDAVDGILDEILGEESNEDPDLDDNGEEDEFEDDDLDGNGEDDGYDTLSELFVATDKLLKKRDPERILDFRETVDAVLDTQSPFGVEAEMWADIQSAARNASVALEADSAAPIDADLKGLYNQLQLLV
jgi:hypothetical protein